jgi:hypothetical protein
MMKDLRFSYNDYVSVALSDAGAQHISNIHNDFYNEYPELKSGKCNYKEGEIYRTQFWHLVGDFYQMIKLGFISPFLNGEITVESSIES